MKFHPLLILTGTLFSLAAPRTGCATDPTPTVMATNLVINPTGTAAELSLQGPQLDGSPSAPGLTLGYAEASPLSPDLGPLAVGLFRLYRPSGLYQWQFTGPAGGRLAMELTNEHGLILHSSDVLDHTPVPGVPDPDSHAIKLQPGRDGGVFFNGNRLASAADPALSIAGGSLVCPPDFYVYPVWSPNESANGLLAAGPSSLAFGSGSVAMGISAVAELQNSIALGYHAFASSGGIAFGSYASAEGGTALGGGSRAGYSGTALGPNTYARGMYSTALGANAYAGEWTSIGLGGWASAVDAIAIGAWADGQRSWSAGWGSAAAENSVALGGNAYGFKSLAVHSGVTWAPYSVAIGRGAVAAQDYQVALGALNDYQRRWQDNGQPQTAPQPGDPIFVIGNGYPVNDGDPQQYQEVRSNAFTVGYNGDTGIQGGVHVQGGPVSAPVISTFDRDVSVKGVLRVPESGDLSMGAFTAGTPP